MDNQPTYPTPPLAVDNANNKHVKRRKFLKIVSISALAVCLIASGFGAGFLLGTKHSNASSSNVDNISGVQPLTTQKTSKLKVSMARLARLAGVVTKVTATSLTIAGGGKAHDVAITSNTTYAKNVKPVVNDSVVAVGATKNGVFTATRITVEP